MADGQRFLDEKRYDSAVQHLHKACVLGGHSSSCVAAGRIYWNRLVLVSNKDYAIELFARACKLGNADGCSDLAVATGNPERRSGAGTAGDSSGPNASPPNKPIVQARPAPPAAQSQTSGDEELERKLITTCNRVLGATTKLYQSGGKQAVLDFEKGSTSVLRECRRRNIQIRPAAMDQEIDAQLNEINAKKKALEARQLDLDKAMCTKQNQIFANVFKLDGLDGFLKEEASSIEKNPRCQQLGLLERPPQVTEMVRLCREMNGYIAEGNQNAERIRILEAKAREAKLKLPPRSVNSGEISQSMREGCQKVGVVLSRDKR